MSKIYWLTRLVHFGELLQVASCVLVMLGLVGVATRLIDEKEFRGPLQLIFLGIVILSVSIFFPTMQDLAMMYGWEVLSSDESREIIDLIKDKLGAQ